MRIELEQSDYRAIAKEVVDALKPYLDSKEGYQNDVIFDKKQLAAYLNIDVSWIDKNYEEKLPHFHLGKYVRFKKSQIDGLADAHGTRVLSLAKTLRKRATS